MWDYGSTDHGSSSNCLAILRSSGSHPSINFMNLIKSSISCSESRHSRLPNVTPGMGVFYCAIQAPSILPLALGLENTKVCAYH